MADVSLSKSVRSNLLSLQSTAASMAKTQERLATGMKVNSALDNPTNFFTASALNSRASDMANLLDSMSSGIKTIEAADNGLSSITKTVETMQSTLRQARQDKSFKTGSYAINVGAVPAGTEKLTLSGGAFAASQTVDLTTTAPAVTGVPATLVNGAGGADLTAANLSTYDGKSITLTADNGSTSTYTFTNAAAGQSAALVGATGLGQNGFTVTASTTGLSITRADGSNFTIDSSDAAMATATGLTDLQKSTNGVVAVPAGAPKAKSVDALVTEINSNTALNSAVRASNDNGKLRLENLSTSDMNVAGISSAGEATGVANTVSIAGNDVRKNLVKQFNDLRDQLDKFADDSSFNGINLLRGDKLKLTFNETGTSTIEIQAKDEGGVPTSISNTALGIDEVFNTDFDSDAKLDAKLETLSNVMGKLRSHSSSFGSNLSIVENRTDFTKNMINTLETGASNLTLADTNEEAANLLALQTRQQLSSTALSMASQADQAVLRLF